MKSQNYDLLMATSGKPSEDDPESPDNTNNDDEPSGIDALFNG